MDGSMDDTRPLAHDVPDVPDVPGVSIDVGEGCALGGIAVALALYAALALAVWALAGLVF